MKTNELLKMIGEPVGSMIIRDLYGNATLHAKGFWSCDPCYLPEELHEGIRLAHEAVYPWEGRDYKKHDDNWMPFSYNGHTLYARSCCDGDGYFGNCVDAGWVVVFPFEIAPEDMKKRVTVTDK